MTFEADAALFALSEIGTGDVIYLPKDGFYAVICEIAADRLYVKRLRSAVAWRRFERGGRRAFRIGDRNLFAWGGMFLVKLSEVRLGQ